MLFLACTEHTSTMSPVNETQDYDCLHRVKGAVTIWSLREYMCRIESQKAMDCVQFAVNACICICEMLFLTCTEHTSIMSPEFKNKGLLRCVCRIEGQKATKSVPFAVNVYAYM